MSSPYRIGLIGAGGVGLYYLSFFAQINCHLTIVTRDAREYTQKEITIQSYLGDQCYFIDDIVSFHDSSVLPFDCLIIATKVLPEIDILALSKPFISSKTVIMMIQNGLNVERALMQHINQPILRGLGFICVERQTKNLIQHFDYGQLCLGVVNGDKNDPKIHDLLSYLDKTDLKYTFSNNINYEIWKKLLWNAPFNPLSVYFGGVDTFFLLNHSEALNYVNLIMDEVLIAAKLNGVSLSDSLKSQMIKNTQHMKPYKTSMCLDYERGAPLEIDAILGEMIRTSAFYNQDLPISNKIYSALI
ncbi:MAG: 2-dehydropantoate 2-reductase [Candidatus Margulisiibacteriota bacterium]